MFILTPAMYKRSNNLLPEYKLIINKEEIIINIEEINKDICLKNIETAISNYILIE